MQDLRSLIIVHLVEERPEGNTFPRKRADWPLHVTLVPWFNVSDDKRELLLTALQTYAASKQSFGVHVGDEEQFGATKDVPVNLLVEQAPVAQLHNELMAIVQQYGVQFHNNASAYSGVEQIYRAHITHHRAADGLHRRFSGDEELFDGITVARLLDDNGSQVCEILRNMHFAGGSHEAAA